MRKFLMFLFALAFVVPSYAQHFKNEAEVKALAKTDSYANYALIAECYASGDCGLERSYSKAASYYKEAWRKSKDPHYRREEAIARMAMPNERPAGLRILESLASGANPDSESVSILANTYCENASNSYELEKCCNYSSKLSDFSQPASIYASARCIVSPANTIKVMASAALLKPDVRADKLMAQLHFDSENREELIPLLEGYANKGHAWAQDMLGVVYGQNWEGQNLVKSERLLTRAARQNYYPAFLHLGQFYLATEKGAVKKNAINWLTKAARQGNYDAILLLSVIYYTGNADRVNGEKFVRWAKEAVNMDATNSLLANICTAYYEGYFDLKPDHKQALTYCKKATDILKDDTARGYYALLLLENDKEPIKNSAAMELLQKSAEGGVPQSNLKLAEIYYLNRDQDPAYFKKAYMFIYACYKANMVSEILPPLSDLEGSLTADEIEVLRHDSNTYSHAIKIYLGMHN